MLTTQNKTSLKIKRLKLILKCKDIIELENLTGIPAGIFYRWVRNDRIPATTDYFINLAFQMNDYIHLTEKKETPLSPTSPE